MQKCGVICYRRLILCLSITSRNIDGSKTQISLATSALLRDSYQTSFVRDVVRVSDCGKLETEPSNKGFDVPENCGQTFPIPQTDQVGRPARPSE